MKNKYFHLAAFDAAIDNNKNAKEWLSKYNYPILIVLANAVNNDESAIKWLLNNELEAYIIIAQKIRESLEKRAFDPHKLFF